MSVLMFELRAFNNFRPTFRLRTHINPILRAAKPIRVIKHKQIIIKPNTSLIPKKPTLLTQNKIIKPKVF
jgi:hypothetical protein